MNTALQNIRGDVYRQLKEVFDASFLQDSDAINEYQEYTQSIQKYLAELHELATESSEEKVINNVNESYDAFYQQTVKIFDRSELSREQRKNLDKGLERQTLVHLEDAFLKLTVLMNAKQASIVESKARWTSRLVWIASIPVLLSIALLVLARRFIKKNVVTPLSDVIEGAKSISKGDLDHSITEVGVTELIRLAHAINKMAEDLIINRDNLVETKKQAALGELIPLVAHNIRNPLAGIRAAAQVACDDDVSAETRDTLTDIIIAVDRLERWVTSLLSYLHPVKPHFSIAPLTDVVDNALTLIELQLIDKKITIKREGWSQVSANVSLDINLFEQVIFNLVQNAFEASSEGDSIILEYRQTDDAVHLSIIDQGRGMTFDPVSEQVMDGETKRLSCGLGIPFAMKVIKQHGGNLRYTKPTTGGTAVVITLKKVDLCYL